jgi:hypothetical protein
MPRLRPFLAAALLLAAGCTPSPDPAGWSPLFDGRSLAGWVPSGFDAEGAVRVEPDFRGGGPAILLQRGTTATGITWTRGAELPPSFAATGRPVPSSRAHSPLLTGASMSARRRVCRSRRSSRRNASSRPIRLRRAISLHSRYQAEAAGAADHKGLRSCAVMPD